MENREKIAIIVPTKDRPDELRRLLGSIASQSEQPYQVIIVDGGADSVERLASDYKSLRITYVRVIPPSLTAQRNAGIRNLKKDLSIVAFLDDDIVLEPDSILNMMNFWTLAGRDVGGAAFNLVNEIYKRPTIIERLFFVNSTRPSAIRRSGFQGKVSCVEKSIQVDWLVGCAMTFRKEIFDKHLFDEKFSGYARYEDVDFSFRVGREYKLFIVADARLRHLNSIENIDSSFAIAKMEVINRLYFVSKYPLYLSKILCYWALFGILLSHSYKGFILRDLRSMRRAQGTLAGFGEIFRKKAKC